MIQQNETDMTTIIKQNYAIVCGVVLGFVFWFSDIFLLHTSIVDMDRHHQIMRWAAFATILAFSIIVNIIAAKYRQLDEKAEAADKEVEQIFQMAADGMRIFSTDCTILRANRTFSNLTGLTEEEIVGKKCYDVFRSPYCNTPECPVTQILSGKKINEIETEITKKDGEKLTCIITSTPFLGPNNEIIGIVEHVKDITPRKKLHESLIENEERLRELFDNTTNMIQSVGPDGRIIYVNKAWHEILGYDEQDVRDLNVFDIIAPESKEQCMLKFRKITEGKRLDGIEATFIAKDGKRVYVEGNASCKLVDGKPAYTRSIFQDVTERKQAEQEKERLIQELQIALDEIKTLSGILPICAYCKKIRDDEGYWNKVESYIASRSNAKFSHCICPGCLKKHYPECAEELAS